MPPQRTIEDDDACWVAALGYSRATEPSYIEFSEHDGAARCFFVGNNTQASEAAIELVNSLVRWDFPNPKDEDGDFRIIAGRSWA